MQAMAPTFFSLYISNGISWTDPHNVMMLRVLFCVSTLIQVVAGLYVYYLVSAKNDSRKIAVPATAQAPASEQTVRDYDMAQIKTYLTSIVTNTAFMAFFHFKLEAAVPVYFQISFGLFRIWDWEMFRLHVLNESVEDFPNLSRPFPLPPNPLQSLMSAFNPPAEEGAASSAAAPPPPVQNGARVEVIDEEGESKKTK